MIPACQTTAFALVRSALLRRGLGTVLEQLPVAMLPGATQDDYQSHAHARGRGPDVLFVDADLARSFCGSLADCHQPVRVVVIGIGDAPLELSLWVPGLSCAWLAVSTDEAALEQTCRIAVSCQQGRLAGTPATPSDVCRECPLPVSLRPTALPISAREHQIFTFLSKGIGPSKIATQLGISVRTVESHRAHIGAKLGAGSQAQLHSMAVAWRFGFLHICNTAHLVAAGAPPGAADQTAAGRADIPDPPTSKSGPVGRPDRP